jgi:DNA-binding NarL/FixJ family response regulator
MALRVAAPLADALDYAHTQGVVHSGLKPSNILMDSANRPILADFGLARMLDAKSYVTNQTAVLGTPEYIAPEVVLGKPAEPRSDVYALGILFYEMLLARAPFQADTAVATALAHVTEPVRFPNDANPGHPSFPPGVRKILLKALAKDAADRYQRAGELVAALARTTSVGERETQMLNLPAPSSENKPVLGDGKGGYAGGQQDASQPKAAAASGQDANAQPESAARQISVFLVEDHAFVLDALRAVIEDDDSLAVVGDAASAEDALQRLEQARPDVIVMDITLPGLSGIEATKQIKSRWPETQVLILSGHGEQFLTEAIAAGADGYIIKTADTSQVRRAIHEVSSGGSPIDLNLARSLFKKVAENTGVSLNPPNLVTCLLSLLRKLL